MSLKYKILEKIKNKISSKSYLDHILYKNNKINCLDIGSLGDLKWPITSIDKKFINIIKFDAQYVENVVDSKNKFNNLLWGTEEEKDFFINEGVETSSLFQPNLELLKYYPGVERFNVTSINKIKTNTLKNILIENNNCDFLKLDVQGSELEVLKGADDILLDNLVALEIEVSFAEIYLNQPLFSDIDVFLRKNYKLQLWDLNSQYFLFKNINNGRFNNKGRLMWADALYLRPIEGIDRWLEKFDVSIAKQKILSLIGIVTAYGYNDYISTLLQNKKVLNLFNQYELNKLKLMLKKNSTLFKIKLFNNFLFFLFSTLANIFRPLHNKFSYGNSNLGTRKFLRYFFKQ